MFTDINHITSTCVLLVATLLSLSVYKMGPSIPPQAQVWLPFYPSMNAFPSTKLGAPGALPDALHHLYTVQG